jgi:4-amino-4-deoxy-L-arabinose transferase-like glycosyltransferase
LILGIIALILVGGFFRFADLAYSEFQGDEARAMLRAAEVIQGHPDAVLGHKKGPAEILLPAAAYSLIGRMDEPAARLPFALAHFAGLFALFVLGWRLFGPLAGWAAAMLLALDGYFIGFSQIVQYQSVVFLTVVLTVLILVCLVQQPEALTRYLTLAAILLATGLLAHYEAALVALPCLYLLYRLWRDGIPLADLGRAMFVPLLVGAVLLASFYVPFVRNPNFAVTYAYITVNRIGVSEGSGGFPYNNLVDVFERTMLYSSSYYVFLLVGLAVAALCVVYWRGLRNRWRWLAIGMLLAGVIVTLIRPTWLTLPGLPPGRADHTWAFFALALAVAWVLPRFPWQERTVWLWFGAPMVLALFFTRTPNTHVYGFFIPWALIAGWMIARIWRGMRVRLGARMAGAIAAPTAAALLLLFGTYEYWYFVHNDVEILRTWRENRPAGYWAPYEMPTNMSIFGFPFRNGWKTVGTLYADGTLDGPFDTNGRDAVGDWYTRGAAYCPRDHRYFIFSQAVEPAEAAGLAELRARLEQEYDLMGVVQVKDEPRLHIYAKPGSATGDSVRTFDDSAHADRFDAELSDPLFERGGSMAPALARQRIQQPLDYRFQTAEGEPIARLHGFSLDRTRVAPGQEIELTLYWEASGPTAQPYVVFNQIIDPVDYRKVGQLDGEPVCNLRPTTGWLPGEWIADRYRIPIFPDAAPGTYTLLIGLYERESGSRAPIFTADGHPAGDALSLIEITIDHAPGE